MALEQMRIGGCRVVARHRDLTPRPRRHRLVAREAEDERLVHADSLEIAAFSDGNDAGVCEAAVLVGQHGAYDGDVEIRRGWLHGLDGGPPWTATCMRIGQVSGISRARWRATVASAGRGVARAAGQGQRKWEQTRPMPSRLGWGALRPRLSQRSALPPAAQE